MLHLEEKEDQPEIIPDSGVDKNVTELMIMTFLMTFDDISSGLQVLGKMQIHADIKLIGMIYTSAFTFELKEANEKLLLFHNPKRTPTDITVCIL